MRLKQRENKAPTINLKSCPRCSGDIVDPYFDHEPYCLQCGHRVNNWPEEMRLDVDDEVQTHQGFGTIGKFAIRSDKGFTLTYPGMKVKEA